MADGLVEIVTTVGSHEEARVLARPLVESGLVACAHMERIRSIYRWEGRVEDGDEIRVTLKVLATQAQEVERRLAASHPYDTPMILRRTVSSNEAYLAWAKGQEKRS